jgi:hypothetical protein
MDIKLGKKHFFKNHICDGFFYLFHIERPITRYSIARLKGPFCRAGHKWYYSDFLLFYTWKLSGAL